MKYSDIVDCYSKLESVSKRNDMIGIFASLLNATPVGELQHLIYLTQGKIEPDYKGVELGIAEKLVEKAITRASGLSSDVVRKNVQSVGDVGTVCMDAMASKTQLPLQQTQLYLHDVHSRFQKMATTAGKSSTDAKIDILASLFNDASPAEAKFIARTALGELRLGMADYTVIGAIAKAFNIPKEKVENAYNLTSDLGLVAVIAATKGESGISAVKITAGVPCRPMLAERLRSAKAIVEKMGNKAVVAEYKLDGERGQIHKVGDSVVIYSRRQEQITSQYPDVVDLVKTYVKADAAVLDSEIVAFNEDNGEYLPFQELMHRRRKHGIGEAMEKYPVTVNFFDLLALNTADLLAEPYSVRRKSLEAIVKQGGPVRIIPSMTTSDPDKIEKFMTEAIGNGGEGLVIKDPDGGYKAGARDFLWIKLKREYKSDIADTMDLVIVGAFHGKGKRAGVYGAFLLAAYNDDRGIFESVSKVGTGFSDENLKKFHSMLKQHEVKDKPAEVDSSMVPDVWLEPSAVIEVLASEVTLSPTHTVCFGKLREGVGLALRFPRFTGKIRDDKRAEDATTSTEILEMYGLQKKQIKG